MRKAEVGLLGTPVRLTSTAEGSLPLSLLINWRDIVEGGLDEHAIPHLAEVLLLLGRYDIVRNRTI